MLAGIPRVEGLVVGLPHEAAKGVVIDVLILGQNEPGFRHGLANSIRGVTAPVKLNAWPRKTWNVSKTASVSKVLWRTAHN